MFKSPQHWHYVKNDIGEIEGRVTFKNPTPAPEYHVKVYLSVKGSLKSVSFFGEILVKTIDFKFFDYRKILGLLSWETPTLVKF